ncbi:MAG TPA: thrombospondin type 3 repeat-containing protein [Kofleriaceae bacterium]|nr:thrombospondin type 3 repeat-containing protein [Kofleriaceae bacterium]
MAQTAEAVCLGGAPDGLIGDTEGCDDNNTVNGDGCNATCDIEGEYTCARPVKISEIDIEDFPNSTASWPIAPDNQSVRQTANTPAPSVILLGNNGMQGTYAVRAEVKTVNDEDFIGLVLGFRSNDQTNANANYLLIDWKQALEDNVPAGLRLAHVRGVPPGNNTHSLHPLAQRVCPTPTSCAKQLAVGQSHGTTGWQDNTPYEFRVTYRPDRLELRVNGQLEFFLKPTDFPGEFTNTNNMFPPGPIGFYVLSQEEVEVRNLAPPAPAVCNVTSLDPATINVRTGTPNVTINTPALLKDTDDGLDRASVAVVSVTGGATAMVQPDGTIKVVPADPNKPGTYVVTVFACDDDAAMPDCDTTTVTVNYGDSNTNGDSDGDGIPDGSDVCPMVADPDQVDTDSDGLGDLCDEDKDGDGRPDNLTLGISGGGCSTGGGGMGAFVMFGAAAALLLRRRRR